MAMFWNQLPIEVRTVTLETNDPSETTTEEPEATPLPPTEPEPDEDGDEESDES